MQKEGDHVAVPSNSHGAAVADHYNKLKEEGIELRKNSRIFFMRNFNNWIKSMLINDTLERIYENIHDEARINVLDLCGGKGGDLLKWNKGRVNHVTLVDIAEVSVQQAEERFNGMGKRSKFDQPPTFKGEFITADCTKVRLKDKYKTKDMSFDLVSCQFAFHYSFESREQAEMMLCNACECIKPGGYFIGTIPNAYELVKRLRNSPNMSFGNEVYNINFEVESKEDLPLFGARYGFHLEGVVDCPEFLVYFNLLLKMAEKYNMKLVNKKTFSDFYKEQIKNKEGEKLIRKMSGLEGFPPDQQTTLVSDLPEAYQTAEKVISEWKMDEPQLRTHKVGTLSQSEWDATSLYMVFALQKQ